MAKTKNKHPSKSSKPSSRPRRLTSSESKPNGIHKPSPSKPSRKPPSTQASQQPHPPFTPDDRVLLIGEGMPSFSPLLPNPTNNHQPGDFSFALSLLLHHAHTAGNLTATTNDSPSLCAAKYPQSVSHTAQLQSHGGHTVRYGVEVVRPGRLTNLPRACWPRRPDRSPGWDVAVFNFPHVGGRSTDVNRQVRANQELLLLFFKAVVPLLAVGGKRRVVVTLFEGMPYSLWNVRDLARHAGVGLVLRESRRFDAGVYRGYKHARTVGNVRARRDGEEGKEEEGDEAAATTEKRAGRWHGEEREARMYVFEVEGADTTPGTWGGGGGGANGVGLGKRKRKKGSGESEDDESD